MKTSLFIILLLNASILLAQSNNKRRVFLFTDGENNPTLIEQKQILKSDEAGCSERDMIIETYIIAKTNKKILSKYNISAVPFTFLLIGKDGHVALRSYKVIPKAQLFALIDGMPMRRDEMQRRRN